MSDMMENKINDEILEDVTGGVGEATGYKVRPIKKTRIRTTASSLNCRYYPDGPVAKSYEYHHVLWVDGITTDGLWYRLLINDPKGGTCYGYIYKQYTELD